MLGALLIGGLGSPAEGAPILALDLDPALPGVQSSTSLALGGSVVAEIWISGVDSSDPLHAFELDLLFDPGIVAASAAGVASFLATPFLEIENGVGVGQVGLAATTSGPGAAFGSGLLATVTLTASGPGESALELASVVLSEPFGAQILDVTLQPALLLVVPEPGVGMLLAAGCLPALSLALSLALSGRRGRDDV
ncbi:MAG: hypothetical protein QNK05_18920 [Myxococcota bacterium]|nr:hypothetical protein [Myxococcota bacterium]